MGSSSGQSINFGISHERTTCELRGSARDDAMNRWMRQVCEEYDIDPNEKRSRAEKIRLAHQVVQTHMDHLQSCQWKLGEELKVVAADALTMGSEDIDYEPGMECECKDNPIGECVYEGCVDPCWDDCLFCHQPWERK